MAKELIDALGGVKALADILGTTNGAVANWRLADRSIPWRYRHEVARVAADRGIELPTGYWSPRPTDTQGEAA